jgi:hypothetical protein
MKVKCIDNNNWHYLTLGKIYDVIEIDDEGDYYIIDNENDKLWVSKEWFKLLSEFIKERNNKIDKLLE